MKRVFLLAIPLVCLLNTSTVRAQDASSGFDLFRWQPMGVTIERAPQERTRLIFEPRDWPNAWFSPPAPLDWKGKALELETFNPSNKPLEFLVRVDDDVAADGWKGCNTAKMTALPGQKQKWLVSFGADPMSQGMRALPPFAPNGAQSVTANGAAPLNLSHIVKWHIFLDHPSEKRTLDVAPLRLVPAIESNLDGIVDEFGQYTGANWPGKIHSLAELKNAQAAEERDLKLWPQLEGRDRFGGLVNGPKFAATGFFRTQKEDDKWWLVTPEGHPFWSAGVDVVQSGEPTITTGREKMFASLLQPDQPLARFGGTTNSVLTGPQKGKTAAMFDFYAANLWRKYSDDWKSNWEGTALARLRSWGFNTIGNWSDSALRDAKYGEARLPYTATISLWGDHARVSDGQDYWGTMHDPFDPKFAADCAARVAEETARTKDDPYCLGYFVDNELSWGSSDEKDWRTRYGLALGALAADAKSPAKIAFLTVLKDKYPTIEAFNAAWKTNFASWNDLDAPFKLTDEPNDAQKADLSTFLTRFANQYFRIVSQTLKKADPNHLYLGCRFAWRTPEAVQSAARWCDVVSFNIYAKRLDAKEWAFVSDLGKPAIIGEFHMGALDRGLFHPGLVAAKDQAERAQLFHDYLQSVASNPVFVGAHWFQYTDEALTGRIYDGENYNIGFVTAADTPYPELVASARQTNALIYRWHAGK